MSNPLDYLDRAMERANRRVADAKKAAAPEISTDAFHQPGKNWALPDGSTRVDTKPQSVKSIDFAASGL